MIEFALMFGLLVLTFCGFCLYQRLRFKARAARALTVDLIQWGNEIRTKQILGHTVVVWVPNMSQLGERIIPHAIVQDIEASLILYLSSVTPPGCFRVDYTHNEREFRIIDLKRNFSRLNDGTLVREIELKLEETSNPDRGPIRMRCKRDVVRLPIIDRHPPWPRLNTE